MINDLFQYGVESCRENTHLISDSKEDCLFSILEVKEETFSCRIVLVIINKPLIEEVNSSHYIAIFPHQENVEIKYDQTNLLYHMEIIL